MTRLMALLLMACLAAGAALADPPPGKGKGQDKDRDVAEQPAYPSRSGTGDSPGQVTSGCNHQANDLGLKGKDRSAFVERCQRRGGDKWSPDEFGRHCRERAEQLGLRGDDKDRFVRQCREYRDGDYKDPRKR